ncbi:MAG TPA: response regulator [Woeseiaceae bacterium]|nr:response regulator [Woeseiaceae bacterium]
MDDSKPNGGAIRILLVEDEPDAREAVQRFLEFRGHEVRIAATAGEALLSAARCPPDVLVCDWMLDGEIDGVEAAARLQRRHGLSVVLVTAHRMEDLRRRARRAGVAVSVCWRKPLSLSRLADAIETLQRARTAALAC